MRDRVYVCCQLHHSTGTNNTSTCTAVEEIGWKFITNLLLYLTFSIRLQSQEIVLLLVPAYGFVTTTSTCLELHPNSDINSEISHFTKTITPEITILAAFITMIILPS